MLALQHFEVYITSSSLPIKVLSDHNPLIFLHKLKDKNQQLLRWSLMLQEYGLDITHIKGKDKLYKLSFFLKRGSVTRIGIIWKVREDQCYTMCCFKNFLEL